MTSPTLNWEKRIGRRLKLRDLQILSTVVERGSMAKGAKHLGMSQQAVSDAIGNLESAIRVRLLDRSPRGVEPAIYARALLKRGHVVFDELKQGIRDIEFLADPTVGEVRIGCPESMTAAFVPAIVDRLSRQYPRVVVHMSNAQTAEQEFRELRERTVDLMVGRVLKPLVDDDVNSEILCDDNFFVVAGSRSRWARRRKILLEELRDEPWVLFPSNSLIASYVTQALRANGLDPPRESVTSFSLHARLQLLASGRFLTVMFGSVLRRNAKHWSLRVLPVDLGIPPVPIAIFTLKNRTRNTKGASARQESASSFSRCTGARVRRFGGRQGAPGLSGSARRTCRSSPQTSRPNDELRCRMQGHRTRCPHCRDPRTGRTQVWQKGDRRGGACR